MNETPLTDRDQSRWTPAPEVDVEQVSGFAPGPQLREIARHFVWATGPSIRPSNPGNSQEVIENCTAEALWRPG